MSKHPDIEIGTLVICNTMGAVDYVKQILPHGFESFQLTFGGRIEPGVDLPELAARMKDTIGGSAVISSLGVYANPLGEREEDLETLRTWERLIDNAHLFGADIVAGFAGRVRGQSIPASILRFKEVFTPLAKRAADRGVKIAFENCSGGGTWHSGDYNIAHNPSAWELMFDAVPGDHVGLEWEPCHQMVALIDPLPQLREWIGKVIHVHGKDATVLWDVVRKYGVHGSKRFTYDRTPGFGDTNWTDVISILRQGGYTGSIDIEGWHDPVYRDELEMTGQVHGLNYLKRCRTEYVPNPV